MTEYKLPTDLEEAVITLLYRRAADLGWTYLTDQERTRYYQEWTSDPVVGGRLLGFMGKPENVRPWLKDVVMKEYARALQGVGKYARFVAKPATALEQLVAKSLGPDWVVDEATQKVKPLRVIVRHVDDDEDERHFVWGPARDIKHLVWPAIIAKTSGDTRPWTVCVLDSFVRRVTPEKKALHERIAEQLGLQVTHVTEG